MTEVLVEPRPQRRASWGNPDPEIDALIAIEGVRPLNSGDLVSLSFQDLRNASTEDLMRIATQLGLSVRGLSRRNQVLTRLFETAVGIKDDC